MNKEYIEYCTEMGEHIEQLDSDEFINEYLVDEQFNIYTEDGHLWIDFISGVNYYGEISTTLEIYPDNTFRVERYGVSVGEFKSDDLYDGLMEALYDIIEKR